MIHITYESGPFKRFLHRMQEVVKYRIVRPVVSFFYYWLRHKKTHLLHQRDMNGNPLKEGISFCVPAKNEEYTVPLCLESLIGFVNQIIFIDNGSTDKTLEIVRKFKVDHPEMEVIILEMPDSSLIEMRQEALQHVNYKWFIRGDADMLFTDAFKQECRKLLRRLKRPAAIQISKVELFGNVSHYHNRFGKYSFGEYFLRSFDDTIRYHEYFGRLEHAPLPMYYAMKRTRNRGFFHLNSFKDNDRIIYRTSYLDWREYNNNPSPSKGKLSFDEYERYWQLHNFGTTEPEKLKYRYARLIASMCAKHENAFIQQYPERLKQFIDIDPFVITEKDGHSYLRFHQKDRDFFNSYSPDEDDLLWTPDVDSFYRDSIRKSVFSTS